MRDVNAASWPAANESVLFFVVVPPLSARGPGSRNARLLAECAKSLRAFSYHFALIDNGVETVNNSTLMRHLAGDPNVVILEGNHFYSLGAFTVAWKYLSSGGGREICESCQVLDIPKYNVDTVCVSVLVLVYSVQGIKFGHCKSTVHVRVQVYGG